MSLGARAYACGLSRTAVACSEESGTSEGFHETGGTDTTTDEDMTDAGTRDGDGDGDAYNDGVTGNGTQSGVLTFVVPTNAPAQLFYNCEFHSVMTGVINVID